MQTNTYTPIVFFALNQESVVKDLEFLASKGIDTTQVRSGFTGSWEGETERSYFVTEDFFNDNAEALHNALVETDQDAVLYLDNQRNAFVFEIYAAFKLVVEKELGHSVCGNFGDVTEASHVGTWKQVNPTILPTLKGWTRNDATNTYYAAV